MNSDEFLLSVQSMYRMDRGDRLYVRRHFEGGVKLLKFWGQLAGEADL